MTIFKLALGLIQLVTWLMKEAERQKLINEGERLAYERAEKLMRGRIKRAMEVRREVRERNSAIHDAGRLPDDGFRRD